MEDKKETCFVIMPFGKTTDEHTEEYWTNHYNVFLKPLIESNPKFVAKRAESLRGDILRQIITDLVSTPIVVADLTDHNPNVFWELGVRQSFKHGTVTIAQCGTKLPFDISGNSTLFYHPKDHIKDKGFEKQLLAAIEDCIQNKKHPDSAVLETTSGRGTLFEILEKERSLRKIEAVIIDLTDSLEVFRIIIASARENQTKLESEMRFTPVRLGVNSLITLTTERYLDIDNTFYDEAINCLSFFQDVNKSLDFWPLIPNRIQNWLLTDELFDDYIIIIRSLLDNLKKIQNELRDRK